MRRPSLDLDWEEGIFRGLRALWRAATPAPRTPYDPGRAALLADHQAALRVFAQLIAGEPVHVLPARGVGGVRGRDLLLPEWMDLAPDPEANRGLYLVRAAISAELRRARVPAPEDPAEALLAGLAAAQGAASRLAEALPRFGQAHSEALALALAARPDPAGLRGRAALEESIRRAALAGERPWEAPGLAARLSSLSARGPTSPEIPIWGRLIPVVGEGAKSGDDGGAPPPPADATEAAAPTFEELEIVSLSEEDGLQLPAHVFEKVETAEAFQGTVRDLDGSDELEDHLEALAEVDLAKLVRGGEQARSVLKAEIALDAEIPDVERIGKDERALLYDEWDGRRGRWRRGWCSVYPTAMPRGDRAWADAALARNRRLVDKLHASLEIHRAIRRPRGRRLDGDDIDLEALVDARADLAAGREPDPRLYIRRERAERDLATTVLLDVSLSTDAWVQNRRVLDVAREAVLVLGEVADRLGDRLQVLAFASKTRNQVRVWEVRGWDEPWSAGRGRLGRLVPQGYTRIGPALRHATAELKASGARQRLLLLVSDGKPTDYDRYEGRYGIADVRRAIREARDSGICTHGLAVDAVARDYLPAMMGPGAWSVLPHPGRLPEALTSAYGRLS